MHIFDSLEYDVAELCRLTTKVTAHQNNTTNTVKKLLEKDIVPFRVLDNISYVSVCSLMTLYGSTNNDLQEKIIKVRDRVRQSIETLIHNDLLLTDPNEITVDSFCEDNFFMDQFLTYDVFDKQTWMLHLLAGIFLNFYSKKYN